MYKRNIQRLTQTYLTLSLQDIANTAQINTPKEAEMHVLEMVTRIWASILVNFISNILNLKVLNLSFHFVCYWKIEDGEIFATINQKDGMVRFLEDPEQYKTCEMIEHIDSSIQRYDIQIAKVYDHVLQENTINMLITSCF